MRASSQFITRTKSTFTTFVAGVFAATGLLVALPTPAFAASNTVSPASPNGWMALDDNGKGGSLRYVSGPAGASGNGSAELRTDNATQGYMLYRAGYAATKLSGLGSISYRTYVQQGNNTIVPSIQINIDKDVSDTDASWQGRLVYEPYMSGTVVDNQWQSWDASAGKWWFSKPSVFNNICGQATPCTLADLTAAFPNIGVNSGQLAGIGFKAGSGWATPFVGNIDTFTFGSDSYNFEPTVVSACTTTASVVTTDLSKWDLSRTRANGHNVLVDGGLRIYTDGNTDTGPRSDGNPGVWNTDKAAGYYPADFNLRDMGNKTIAQSIDYAATLPATPGLQMVTDFDNDGSIDGILVGEAVYGNNWWLSEGKTSVQTNAPNIGGGNGSPWYGTPDEWLSKFPNARVKAIGYSLGSGVHGDGILKRISLGCTDYTFDLPSNTDGNNNSGSTVENGSTANTSTGGTAPVVATATTNSSSTDNAASSGVADDNDNTEAGGEVLGTGAGTLSTTTDNGDVKGDSTNQDKDNGANSNFLGLGWWWLAVLAALMLIIFGLLRRRSAPQN